MDELQRQLDDINRRISNVPNDVSREIQELNTRTAREEAAIRSSFRMQETDAIRELNDRRSREELSIREHHDAQTNDLRRERDMTQRRIDEIKLPAGSPF